ncbi:hypothetical protein IE81DRAFT_99699 [Ceraceosorus guamensis]|uniref:Uncharacterized protein n=1 Tax=Ceraceosorus guamensis TaxID=1522189 RepID=A0A316W0E7_9BASI|nr:hypothetical protein IE81DRAFT_99699 [Ceraceosorus guamensis]PWN43202.1 hypothetical protein IE81DRAFT_99699 [Ceraceosorus guamensis]
MIERPYEPRLHHPLMILYPLLDIAEELMVCEYHKRCFNVRGTRHASRVNCACW